MGVKSSVTGFIHLENNVSNVLERRSSAWKYERIRSSCSVINSLPIFRLFDARSSLASLECHDPALAVYTPFLRF